MGSNGNIVVIAWMDENVESESIRVCDSDDVGVGSFGLRGDGRRQTKNILCLDCMNAASLSLVHASLSLPFQEQQRDNQNRKNNHDDSTAASRTKPKQLWYHDTAITTSAPHYDLPSNW